MPLYTDSNYYYSGGSSQLFSPYYPSSSTLGASSSYSPYTSTYNRAVGGSYVVPISTSRSPSYSLVSSSRYQPKLSTITESSPLMSAARHSSLMPLTRINSPKYSGFSSSTPVHLPKYIPPKPILINTADIDVSANRYRRRKEEALRQAQIEHEAEMAARLNKRPEEQRQTANEAKNKEVLQAPQPVINIGNVNEDEEPPRRNRSTIKRNRAVVRLSTIRARSKDRNRIRVEDLYSPEPEEKKFKEPSADTPADVPDVAANESVPENEDLLLFDKDNLQEVVVELDPEDHTVRRLSIPQCPTFHDICEDISSDKIDDDLNAGELRRRQSVIHCQEQQLLNQFQNSPCGTYQIINLERRDSHDSSDGQVPKRHSKRQSKKGNKVRHKITAIVEVENASPPTEQLDDGEKSPLPKFTINVDSVEEHHEIHKVFKLPKKKIAKKVVKPKDQQLPEGFMTAIARPETSPKKKMVEKKEIFKPEAEIFTFDEKAVQQTKMEEASNETLKRSQSEDVKSPSTPSKIKEVPKKEPKTPTLAKTEESLYSPKLPKTNEAKLKKLETPVTPPMTPKTPESKEKTILQDKPETPKTVKPVVTLDKIKTPLEKFSSSKGEPKTPTTPSKDESKDQPKAYTPKTSKSSLTLESGFETTANKETSGKPKNEAKLYTPKSSKSSLILEAESNLQKMNSQEQVTDIVDKTNKNYGSLATPIYDVAEKPPGKGEGVKSPTKLTTSSSKDMAVKPSVTKNLASKPEPATLKESKKDEQPVATPKPIRKGIKKSESGEDFWAQIGSRETLYMTKRKQELLEIQWKKRENLLESTTTEEVGNLEDIKTTVKQQKDEALKKAQTEEISSTKGQIGRSSSNDSALKKEPDIGKDNTVEAKNKPETPSKDEVQNQIKNEEPKASPNKTNKVFAKAKSEEENVGEKVMKDELKQVALSKIKSEEKVSKKKITSPKSKVATDEIIKKSSDMESKEAKTKISTPVTEAIAKATSAVNKTTTTATPTKINGQVAKSPEQQEQEEQKTKQQTAQAKGSNNNKNELDINKTSAIATKTNDQPPALLAKALTAANSNVKVTANATGETAATKQPETKASNAAADTQQTAPAPAATTDETVKATKKLQQTDAKKTTATPTKAKTQSPPKAKAKLSPQSVINADQFIAKAPAKSNVSPVKQTKVAASATSSISPSENTTPSAPTKKTPDAKKKTTNATSSNDNAKTSTPTSKAIETLATTPSISASTTTANAAASTTTTCGEIRKEDIGKTRERLDSDDNKTSTTTTLNSTDGGNLSKFATVSNLAQCLQDVDADLDDYIPSSADISEDENYTSDSDFDYSSIDGWDKFTPSMKKKIKQRRRKEKQAEQARFDPQKKVKIDTTRKLYVKEEAPRYPLVATPRPLWKREKIVYPVEDSDESDSEESGSTEETEESDECTTSEEYEDELNPTASGGGATPSGNSNSDPNIIRMSTCSNDSGFEGGTAPSSPKKMLECDVNCHKKCERLTANLCGVNQKLIVEALANVKRGARETRDSPSTPPSLNPAYKIEANEEQDETSYTYSQFQKSGRFTPPATIIPRFKNYSVDDFHFLAVLGKGSFGKVLLAELRDTTYYYAVKCLKKDVVLEDDDVDSTLIERKVLALGTKHPYLCHLFCTFQTESHLFFVMEYLNGGDLMFHIQESGRFTEERARFYGAEIISGLKFLHKKGIIYRDLKLDNVLLDYEGHVRIADFGMCKLQIYLDKTADSFCGTPDYMAPEIIKGESYNQNVDWWSFGVLLYEMLIGQSPFSGCDEDELFWSICNEIPWFPVYISAEATSILKGLLEKDSAKRIGSQYSPAGDIVEHIFFRPIDWNLLDKRQIPPPFRPQVKHPLDTQYFDRVFTRERVRLTPIDKDILQSMDQKQFLGFTYTNPHITLDD